MSLPSLGQATAECGALPGVLEAACSPCNGRVDTAGLAAGFINHGVRKVYHGDRKVYHGVRKVYHGVRKVDHGVRKVYHGVRKVYHGVRKV